MAQPRGALVISALLSFSGGFVDTVGFLGLHLFVAHVTGNFVTLGAALVLGSHGILNKILALPEFIAVIALARIAGGALRRRNLPALRIMLAAECSCSRPSSCSQCGSARSPTPTVRRRC
jgi:uncharacterized membrane protein YoaK (UPF0700 family)